MIRIAKVIAACLYLTVGASQAAEPAISARDLAAIMLQAKYSDGFEARMNVFVTKPNGAHPLPFRLALIGQFAADKQRLVIRGISPELVRDRMYAAEQQRDGPLRAVESRNLVAK